MKIKLGDKVKDKYTGFTGIVMAKTEFINGCVQFMVAEKYDKKKASAEMPTTEMGIDEQSLVLIDKKLRRKDKDDEDDEEEDYEYTGGPKLTFTTKKAALAFAMALVLFNAPLSPVSSGKRITRRNY